MKTTCSSIAARAARVILAAAGLLAASVTLAQTLLVDLDQNVPLVSALDNPCTAQPEVIAFSGAAHVLQRVWLMPSGNLRLQIVEETAMQGQDSAALPGTSPTYSFSGSSDADAEFIPASVSVLNYKKVSRSSGVDDNFHAILVIDFDPGTLKLDLKVEGACDAGLPY